MLHVEKNKNNLREFKPQDDKKFKKTQAEFKIVVSYKTRPDTRQSSRGRLGRSSNAKTARNSKM